MSPMSSVVLTPPLIAASGVAGRLRVLDLYCEFLDGRLEDGTSIRSGVWGGVVCKFPETQCSNCNGGVVGQVSFPIIESKGLGSIVSLSIAFVLFCSAEFSAVFSGSERMPPSSAGILISMDVSTGSSVRHKFVSLVSSSMRFSSCFGVEVYKACGKEGNGSSGGS